MHVVLEITLAWQGSKLGGLTEEIAWLAPANHSGSQHMLLLGLY